MLICVVGYACPSVQIISDKGGKGRILFVLMGVSLAVNKAEDDEGFSVSYVVC